ncbi:aspartate aminotransferase family protein [Kiritimatiellaeota bacterium B1221]|nr:aspartate aminotransferase family protein [Kiritimatiellaeota bacterium B1221]
MNPAVDKALVVETHSKFHTPNYAPSHLFVRGEGSYLWDSEGKKYLDFVSGIAVTALGHCHPAMVEALKEQADKLFHSSNLYYNEHAPFLAETLSDMTMGGKVIFCNSGAEANEGLIKLARKWGSESGRHEIITMKNSFHGRTLATLTATGQDKIQKGFAPLPEGFVYADYNNLDSVKACKTDKTVAVMLELVQAEGGVVPADGDFIQGLAAWCRENNLLLLLDEIQTGVGRTGRSFAYKHYDIEPDAISLAKGLGGGFPMGAVVTGKKLQDVFGPGSHGTTFGGQPLACAMARTVLKVFREEHLEQHASDMGALLKSELAPLVEKYAFVEALRGQGLLLGLVIDRPAKELEELLAERGLLTVCTAGNVIRMLPPLNVSPDQVREAVGIIDEACAAWKI